VTTLGTSECVAWGVALCTTWVHFITYGGHAFASSDLPTCAPNHEIIFYIVTTCMIYVKSNEVCNFEHIYKHLITFGSCDLNVVAFLLCSLCNC
jgi:hypothetical protein